MKWHAPTRREQMRQHYLFSVDTMQGMIVHCYAITDGENKDDREAAVSLLISETEKHYGQLLVPPMVLGTPLEQTDDIALVESYVRRNTEAAKALDNFRATPSFKHYVMVFTTNANSPLMELH